MVEGFTLVLIEVRDGLWLRLCLLDPIRLALLLIQGNVVFEPCMLLFYGFVRLFIPPPGFRSLLVVLVATKLTQFSLSAAAPYKYCSQYGGFIFCILTLTAFNDQNPCVLLKWLATLDWRLCGQIFDICEIHILYHSNNTLMYTFICYSLYFMGLLPDTFSLPPTSKETPS